MPDPQSQPRTFSVPDLIRQEAIAAGVPPELALAVGEQESGFNPTLTNPQAVNGEHATGTFQLLPSTAHGLGVDPNDPYMNIRGGVRYLRQLLDTHQGDLDKVLGAYGGVKTDTSYVPAVKARIAKFANPGADPTLPHPVASHEPGFLERHPIVNDFVQGLDPHEQEGRRNYAGLIGGTIGGALGAMTSPLTGPVGPYAGGVLGAGTFGAAEDLLVEQTGLGDWLGRTLPGGSVDRPVAPPTADNAEAFQRAANVGLDQALFESGGRILTGGGKYLARAALETRVGRIAAQTLAAQKTEALTALRVQLERMMAAHETAGVGAARVKRAFGGAATTRVEDIRAAQQQLIDQARGAKRTGVRTAVKDMQGAMRQARTEAEAAEQAAREAHQADLLSDAQSGGVSPSAAGRGVSEVFEGPGRDALDLLGQGVSAAAESGPNRSIAAAQAEARRILETEILPPEVEFPREPAAAPAASPIIDPTTGQPFPAGPPPKPPINPRLAALLQQIDDAQLQQLTNHPATKILSRILNAPETVDFKTLHLLESQLRRSTQGSGDRVINDYLTDITRHLTGVLRETLAGGLEHGAQPHVPFEEASKAYAEAVKLFTEGHAPTIKGEALANPEAIVDALSPERATAVKMIRRVLTVQAAAGGGKEAGAKALQQLQDAWFHKFVASGPVDTLLERVSALKLKPEFVDALFNDTYGKQLLGRAEQLGTAFQQLQTRGAERVASARELGRAAVERATDTGEQGIAKARQKAAAAILAERRAGRATKDVLQRATEDANLSHSEATRAQREAIRQRELGTPEEQAFDQSPLNPRVANEGRSARGRQLEWAVRAALAGAGFNAFGPMGIMIGAAFRTGRSVPEADLLKFAVHSDAATRAVINGLFSTTGQAVGNVGAGVLTRGTASVLTAPPPMPPSPPPRQAR